MVTTIGGPRVLLRQLRETMAEPLASQERLDKIVGLIADNMRADVCSFYVLRDDGALELFASKGLAAESVHMTTLRLGEGLVGLIAAEAEPLSLDDAPSHPAFAYRPETGEERYNAFLGVPVLRAGQTLGVLVVQNAERRHYGEDETEAMLTTATILAEMIATSDFDNLIKPGSDIDLRRPRMFTGVSFTDGIALGTVVLHDPRVVVSNFIAEDTDAEKLRLETALEKMRVSIDAMLDHGDMQSTSDHREILETYRMFANDRGWVHRLTEAIDNGLSAEAAVERVQNDTRARMMRQTDPYIRDRLHDLDDLANRLLRVLTGDGQGLGRKELPDNAILVARNMGPAELLEYDRTKLRGIVLEEGGTTAHVAIVARSLGMVAVGQAQSIVSMCESGDDIILDGPAGHRASAADARYRAGLYRQGAGHGQAPGALCGAQGQAEHHQGRRRDHAAAQFGAGGRPADARRYRRGRRRAVPHRTAVHDRLQAAAPARAAGALCRGHGDCRRAAGGVPPARYRWRQGAALSALDGRGKPGHGLPLDPAGAGAAGAAAHPDPRAAAGGQRAAAQDPRADGHRDFRIHPDQAWWCNKEVERLRRAGQGRCRAGWNWA